MVDFDGDLTGVLSLPLLVAHNETLHFESWLVTLRSACWPGVISLRSHSETRPLTVSSCCPLISIPSSLLPVSLLALILPRPSLTPLLFPSALIFPPCSSSHCFHCFPLRPGCCWGLWQNDCGKLKWFACRICFRLKAKGQDGSLCQSSHVRLKKPARTFSDWSNSLWIIINKQLSPSHVHGVVSY